MAVIGSGKRVVRGEPDPGPVPEVEDDAGEEGAEAGYDEIITRAFVTLADAAKSATPELAVQASAALLVHHGLHMVTDALERLGGQVEEGPDVPESGVNVEAVLAQVQELDAMRETLVYARKAYAEASQGKVATDDANVQDMRDARREPGGV